VAASLEVDIRVVAGGATVMPFLDDAFDVAFSYSVLQHFDKQVARDAMREMVRVTRPGGLLLVQLANRWGARQLVNQALVALRAREVGPFRVRYWRPSELRSAVEELTHEHRLEVDGFFSLNPQTTDLDLLPPRYRAVVRTSDLLRRASSVATPLLPLADSLYVRARVPG
jgi:SAM-dependent methyltransferase